LLFIPVGNLFLPLPYLPLPYLLFIPEGNLLLPLPYLPLLYLLFIPEGNLLCRCPICRCSICFSFPKGICFAVALFAVALFAFHSRRESAFALLFVIPEGPFCLSFPEGICFCLGSFARHSELRSESHIVFASSSESIIHTGRRAERRLNRTNPPNLLKMRLFRE
jgi:hypothetical protein